MKLVSNPLLSLLALSSACPSTAFTAPSDSTTTFKSSALRAQPKAGGGIPTIPAGGSALFDPAQEGKLGGTSDLLERLAKGAGVQEEEHQGAAAKPAPAGEFKYKGFDSIALHGGYEPDTSATYGLGQGAPRGVPLYRTTPFVFKDSEHAANLFALKELGNIYSRLMNPTNHVLESRLAMLEGAHELAGLSVASGTNAIFYAIMTLAESGDNIVASNQLYGGTYT